MRNSYFQQLQKTVLIGSFLAISVSEISAQVPTASLSSTVNEQQTWKVEKVSYEYKETPKNGAGSIFKSGTETNAGTFTFNEDFSGKYSYTVGGKEITGTFKRDGHSSPKTFLYTEMNQKESVIRKTYKVVKEDEDQMEMSGEEIIVSKDGQSTLNTMFYLRK